MSVDFFATLAGVPCESVRAAVPWCGVWTAEVRLQEVAELSGAVELKIGDTTMRGTVDPARSGTFAGRSSVFVVGGAGAWGSPVAARAYHNDAGAGVRRSAVLLDAAREVGETLTIGSAADGSLGVDWVREAGPASRVLEAAAPGVPWYVGTDGVTRVGDRSVRDVTGLVQVLEHNPVGRAVVLAVEGSDLSVVLPGCSVTDETRGLASFVVHDVEISVDASRVRAVAYGGTSRAARMVAALRALVREGDPLRSFLGVYRYRVFRMEAAGAGPRVELQVVNGELGLPDVLPVPAVHGVAGAWSKLTPGAVVAVAFLDGDPAYPVLVGMTPKNDPGHVPVETTIDATDQVTIGQTSTIVALSTASDFLALAGLVDGEFGKVAAALGSATAPSGGGSVTYGSPYSPASTAAAKVKGT